MSKAREFWITKDCNIDIIFTVLPSDDELTSLVPWIHVREVLPTEPTELEQLRAEKKILVEALEWYGIKAQVSEYYGDSGKKAREALSKVNPL